MARRRFQLIVFDWDGTLIDSTGHIVSAIQAAAAELGWPACSPTTIRELIGLAWPQACSQLYPQYGPADHEHLKAVYLQHFTQQLAQPPVPFSGAVDVLQALADAGVLLAVATSKSRAGLRRDLQHTGLGRYLASSRCADETASKPDPLMLREIMAELSVMPDDTLMVGDTEFDLEMAQQAGISAIGAGYGAHHPERLQALAPLGCLRDIRELLPALGLAEPPGLNR